MALVAAIDAGSNAIRLAIVEVGSTGVLERRWARRYALRLGSEVFASGQIGPEQRRRLLAIFADIAARLQRVGVSRYRAVATSAMRDAANGAAVVESIRAHTGLELEIIPGAEEGRIMRMTLMRALGTLSSDCLLIDLGGGSLELERTTGSSAMSLPLGTLRLLQHCPALCEPSRGARFDEARAAIRDKLTASLGAITPTSVAIGTGGSLDALSRLAGVTKSAVPAIDLQRLPALAKRLARLPLRERAARFGLRADRADTILPASLVIMALAEIYHLDILLVPGTGIRESLLHTLIAEDTRPSRGRDLLQASSYDLALPDRLARMARRLFELLAALHGLWPPALAPLEAAAYLLDGSGHREGREAAQHAVTLLRRSPELDLDESARRVAAGTIAHAVDFELNSGRLTKTEKRAATALGATLRLAAALVGACDAWEPQVDLTTHPIRITVGLTGRIARRAIAPIEQIIGRPMKIA